MAKKGHIPWNKDMKGLLLNDKFIRDNPSGKGDKNPNWKGGISARKNCLDCGISIGPDSTHCHPCSMKHRTHKDNSGKNHYRWNGGKPRCPDCNNEMDYKAKYCNDCSRLGDRNPSWNGGASFHDYCIEFNKALKNTIRKRDKHICAICNKSELVLEETLCVHHIDYNKLSIDPNNLISLCNCCHSKTNYNRDKWKEFFKCKQI